MPVDDKTREALALGQLTIPASTGVVDVRAEDYVDSSGADALRVWVILRDETDEENLSGEDVGRLKASIRESLLAHGVKEFPYVFLAKESDRAAAQE